MLELMGLFIVAEAALENFLRYLYCLFTRRKPHVKGALILKTIVIRDTKELLILGGVVVIRAILAIELGHEEKEEKEEDREEQGEARE